MIDKRILQLGIRFLTAVAGTDVRTEKALCEKLSIRTTMAFMTVAAGVVGFVRVISDKLKRLPCVTLIAKFRYRFRQQRPIGAPVRIVAKQAISSRHWAVHPSHQ